jgi:hypothetical protein
VLMKASWKVQREGRIPSEGTGVEEEWTSENLVNQKYLLTRKMILNQKMLGRPLAGYPFEMTYCDRSLYSRHGEIVEAFVQRGAAPCVSFTKMEYFQLGTEDIGIVRLS